MRPGLLAAAVVGVALAFAATAQAQRQDVIWARQAPGTVITLDGVLDEPAWAKAQVKQIRYGVDNGIPGSGYKEEGGKLAKDSTFALLKFLVVGNQLFMGITVRDSSVGGGPDFNRFDGLLMSIKDHSSPNAPKPPTEYFYSWWYADTCDHDPSAVGKPPHFLGAFGYPTAPATQCDPRTLAQVQAWDGVCKVQGISNSDAVADTGYTIEMRFDLGVIGYDATKVAGDVIEFNISIYDTDWYWPIVLARFSSNRAWWQSPWGRDMWYDEVQIWTKPSVGLNTNPLPIVPHEVTLHQGASTIAVDGRLLEPVWATADSLRITYDDPVLRASYPGILQARAGQYQPTVNGGTSTVFNPGDATVKWFFLGDSLYLGFDVRDEVVQYVNLTDRWDGFIVSLNDRVGRGIDRNLAGRRITFHVGPGGTGVAEDYLLALRDTLNGAKFALALKPNTTVDTVGIDVDEGYTAKIKIDLTKLGYPHGLGDRVLWAGFDLLDGDSYIPSTLSYGTRTWWGRQYENECCPAYVLMAGGNVSAVPGGDVRREGFELLGNSPNPFSRTTLIGFALDRPSRVLIDVFDLAGRRVASQDLGLKTERVGQIPFAQPGLRDGVYLYRLKAVDPSTGVTRAAGSGKMMVLQ